MDYYDTIIALSTFINEYICVLKFGIVQIYVIPNQNEED